MCNPGGCVLGNTGVCSRSCNKKTGGSCAHLPCKSTRGPTNCEHAECVCKPGYCAVDGVCYPAFQNATETLLGDCNKHTWDTNNAMAAVAFLISYSAVLLLLTTC